MPQTIDIDKMQGNAELGIQRILRLNPAEPPVKTIPFLDFPRVVYKHPLTDFRKIEHRNTHHEVVDIETVQTEHLTKTVANDKELEIALADGWVKEPYVPKPLPDPMAKIYDFGKNDGKKKQA